MKKRLQIKAEQQSDGTWKAWSIGGRLVVHAVTKVKAIGIVKMFFGEGEEAQVKEFDTQQDD